MAAASSTQRDRDIKRVHALYQPHEPYGWDVCCYCGDPATTRDHVTPVWYATGLDLDNPHCLLPPLLLVPCCLDCNVRLNGFVAFSLVEKRDELKRQLRHRWKRLLSDYEWYPDEMGRLGHSLRTHISAMEAKRLTILRRLAFPTAEEEVLLRVTQDPPVPEVFQKAIAAPRQGPYTADLPPEGIVLPPDVSGARSASLGAAMTGSDLRKERLRLGLSQERLRRLITPPITQTRICRLEIKNRAIDAELAARLREAFARAETELDWAFLAGLWGAPQLSFLPVLDGLY